MRLKGKKCSKCGEEKLVWFSKDETENTIEVIVDCQNCGTEFPKQFVDKSKDTSRKALEKVAKGCV